MATATKKRGRKLKSYFDGKELRDATAPLSIPVLSTDLAAAEAVKSGHVNDPGRFKECLVAQACNRVFGQDAKVAIMRNTAYVSLPNEKHAIRFAVPAATRQVIAAFDKNESIELGTMAQFVVPSPANSLASHRKAKKKWVAKNPEFRGGDYPRKTTRKQAPSDPLHGVIRNGVYVRV